MATIPTIKVKTKEGDVIVINAEDFDKDSHSEVEDDAPKKKATPARRKK